MKIARDAIEGMTAEAEIGKIYRGKVVTDQGIRRVRRIPAGQGRPGAHQRTGQLPRQADRGHRQDGRRNLGQMPGRG